MGQVHPDPWCSGFGGSPSFTWFADNEPIAREPFAKTTRWMPTGSGYVTLIVVDGRGESARVRVRLG
ncbi:MAG: hypothetical protein ACUVT0_08030 [Thermochromatium sp.]